LITFRAIVTQALNNALKASGEEPRRVPELLAHELRALFRKHGYAVKRVDPDTSYGREMTHDERITFGFEPPSDGDLPRLRAQDERTGVLEPPSDAP
jgi:hypothetical protein